MISSLRGSAVHIEPGALIIEVGGVGLSVAVPTALSQATRVGDDVHVHTSLIVREDALQLFGFATRDELSAFGILLGVSGVGPRSALGVLSVLSVDELAAAVANEDEKPFRQVPGIGPKTAKLIVVSLAGKVFASIGTASGAASAPANAPTTAASVLAALTSLGWTERAATEAIATASEGASTADLASVAALLRLSLATLGPARASGARR